MSLSSLVKSQFSSADRSRGAAYYREYAVLDLEVRGDGASANVWGSRDYSVNVEWGPNLGDIQFWCDCPRYRDMEVCKHIWATLLELDDFFRANPIERDKVEAPKNDLAQRLKVTAARIKPPSRTNSSTLRYTACIDLSRKRQDSEGRIAFAVYRSFRLKQGGWGKPQLVTGDQYQIGDANDSRELIEFLRASTVRPFWTKEDWELPSDFTWPAMNRWAELADLAFALDSRDFDDWRPVSWDDGPPFGMRIKLSAASKRKYALEVSVVRDDEQRPLSEVVSVYDDGLVLFEDRLAKLVPSHAPVLALSDFNEAGGRLKMTRAEAAELVAALRELPFTFEFEADPEFQIRDRLGTPLGSLRLDWSSEARLSGAVEFRYEEQRVEAENPRNILVESDSNERIVRDREAEQSLLDELYRLPAINLDRKPGDRLRVEFSAARLPELVKELSTSRWEILADGRPIRTAGAFPKVIVESDQDWFDVSLNVEFDEATPIGLPELLAAARQKQSTVVLDDGSVGILPEEWLARFRSLLDVGDAAGDKIRFRRSQALLLDAMLAEQESVQKPVELTRLVQRVQRFTGVKPAAAPFTFRGELRTYQQHGLGWFKFLEKFEFGGCLADDMGLGKTIQVLALLAKRKRRRPTEDQPRRPSLVIAPKSLVFNWLEEAARFTPSLNVIDYTGPQRKDQQDEIAESDLVLTTYATARNDIEYLREVPFDYAVLDEAQAIKNPNSLTAKACRLLQSRFRLAMTGTPVENHLGDLWSIMEFLNPGMLGALPAFQGLIGGRDSTSDGQLEMLRTALAPFILRRTKEEVLTELPEKTEQTLTVDLPAAQRKHYDELLEYYRGKVMGRVERDGLKKSKFEVLEALLRLRQAACDTRLLDSTLKTVGGKVTFLVEQLRSVVEDGHKALVFSQFTSLLSLLQESLKKAGVTFEYLDGKTRDRGARVRRFQEDPDVRAFLISLKAGGHGLNLTAADYVFILDPWWNPAAEAQAIDRAHRIGQTKPVVAYRLIARDTIEDKIVLLQQDKRRLAESIITANGSLMRQLSAEDLSLLFS